MTLLLHNESQGPRWGRLLLWILGIALGSCALTCLPFLVGDPLAWQGRLVGLGALLAVAIICGALGVTLVLGQKASFGTLLLLGGTVLIDFSPLAVYRYFLLSDLLLLVGALVVLWDEEVRLVIPPIIAAIFGLLLVSELVSFTRAAAPPVGVFTWLHMAFLMLVFVPAVATLVASRRHLWPWLMLAVIVSAVVQGAAVDWAVWNGEQWQYGSRIAGAWGNTSLWLLACGFIGLVGNLAARKENRLLMAAGLVVLTPAILFLRARMIWLGIIVGCAVLLILQAKKWYRGAMATMILISGLALGYTAGWLPRAVEARVEAALHPRGSFDLISRMQAVKIMTEPFEASPFIGVGLGQSALYLPKQMVAGNIAEIHNVPMNAAVEGGLAAGVAFILLPLALLRLWVAAGDTDLDADERLLLNWAAASIFGIYIGIQFTPSLYEHVFYYLAALLLAMAGSAVAPSVPVKSR